MQSSAKPRPRSAEPSPAPSAGTQSGAIVSVLIPVAVAGAYSYRVPEGLMLAPGDIVAVPLGRKLVIGAVWDDPPDGSVGHNRLRSVESRYPTPPLAYPSSRAGRL